MFGSLRSALIRRYLAGACISLLGLGLVAAPIYDMWDDFANLGWGLMTTVLENLMFLLLAGFLLFGGVWLVRTDWDTEQVTTIASRTVIATGVIGLLIGWGVFTQLFAMGTLKPGVLALDGVLIGSVTSFGLSISSVRAGAYQEQVEKERALNNRVELLYEAASELETATTDEEAYGIVERAIAEAIPRSSFRVVVDTEVVVNHGQEGAMTDGGPKETVDIGHRGRIELRNETLDQHEISTVELFASYLDQAIQRIEREQRLQAERDTFEFINRTLRHDIMGDLSVVEARLKMLERNDAVVDDRNEDHLRVAVDRAEEMEEFVQTMQNYMESVLREAHALEAVSLCQVVDEHVESARESHPHAEIVRETVPDVEIMADDLIDRVFVNLLGNALEHNDSPTPRVVIDGERDGDVVRLRIADNGPGIPEHRRASIFEQGERGTESDGSGFGLYLVKDVIESYDGAIRVRDNEPHGTVFDLDLPVASTEQSMTTPPS